MTAILHRRRAARTSPASRRDRRRVKRPSPAAEEAVDRVGDEPAVPRVDERLRSGPRAREPPRPLERRGGTWLRAPGCGRACRAAGRAGTISAEVGPLVAEAALHPGDRGRDPRHDRKAALRVVDRGLEHVAQAANVPKSRSKSIHASKAPGTQAASSPVPGTRSSPRSRKRSIEAAAGATPWPQTTSTSPRSAARRPGSAPRRPDRSGAARRPEGRILP